MNQSRTQTITISYLNTTHTTLGANSTPQGSVNFATTLVVDRLDWRSAWWALNSITAQIFGVFVKVAVLNEGRNEQNLRGTYDFSVSYAAVPDSFFRHVAEQGNDFNVEIDLEQAARVGATELAALDEALFED